MANRSPVQVVRVTLSIENGISSLHDISSGSLQLGNGIIKDLKVWDDREILVLWESNSEYFPKLVSFTTISNIVTDATSLLNITYKPDSKNDTNAYIMEYHPHTSTGRGLPISSFSDERVLQQFRRFNMFENPSFTPAKLEIRERNTGGEEDSRRILLLSRDKLHYKVFKFAHADALSGEADDEDISMS